MGLGATQGPGSGKVAEKVGVGGINQDFLKSGGVWPGPGPFNPRDVEAPRGLFHYSLMVTLSYRFCIMLLSMCGFHEFSNRRNIMKLGI